MNVTAAQAIGTGASATMNHGQAQPEESGFWTRSRRIGAFIVGLASITGVVIAAIEAI